MRCVIKKCAGIEICTFKALFVCLAIFAAIEIDQIEKKLIKNGTFLKKNPAFIARL
jgi:hypothetical protein